MRFGRCSVRVEGFLCGVGLALSACQTAGWAPPGPQPNAVLPAPGPPEQERGVAMRSVVLGRADSGRPVHLGVGDRLTVELSESPTTGYAWSVVAPAEGLSLLSDEFLAPDAAPGTVGRGGRRRLVYQAVRPVPEAQLLMVLMRPWEGVDAAVDRFSVPVRIDP